MDKVPDGIQERLKPLLTEIAQLFKAPNITIIVRGGDNAPGDLVFGNDNPTLALAALRTFMDGDARKQLESTADDRAH